MLNFILVRIIENFLVFAAGWLVFNFLSSQDGGEYLRFTLALSMATFAFSAANTLRLKVGRNPNTILYQFLFLMKYALFTAWYFDTYTYTILGCLVLLKSQFIISLRERGELFALSLMSTTQPLLFTLYVIICIYWNTELSLNILIGILVVSSTMFVILTTCLKELQKCLDLAILKFSHKEYLRILGYIPVILLPFIMNQMDRLLIITKFSDIILSEYGKFDVIAQIPYALGMMTLFYWHKLILTDDVIFSKFKIVLKWRIFILLIVSILSVLLVFSNLSLFQSDILSDISLTLILVTKTASVLASGIVIYWQRFNKEYRNSIMVLLIVLLLLLLFLEINFANIVFYQLFHIIILLTLILVPLHDDK